MKKIRYGNTNTFYIDGEKGGLLIDTDYAGTLPQFFKAIKAASIEMNDISYVLCTHYHPDHMGIISELQKLGVTLLIVDVQSSSVHFADEIFFRDKRLDYKPIDEALAKMICCENSRNFLCGIGICGEKTVCLLSLTMEIVLLAIWNLLNTWLLMSIISS